MAIYGMSSSIPVSPLGVVVCAGARGGFVIHATSCAFVVEPIIRLNVAPREAVRVSESPFDNPVPAHPRT